MYRKVRCATGRHVPEGQCATGLEQGNAFEKVVRNKVVATGRVPRNMVGATGRVPPNMVIPNRKLGRNAVTQKTVLRITPSIGKSHLRTHTYLIWSYASEFLGYILVPAHLWLRTKPRLSR